MGLSLDGAKLHNSNFTHIRHDKTNRQTDKQTDRQTDKQTKNSTFLGAPAVGEIRAPQNLAW